MFQQTKSVQVIHLVDIKLTFDTNTRACKLDMMEQNEHHEQGDEL